VTRAALFTKHQKIAEGMAGDWYLVGADRDDVVQELRIALWEASGSWDPGRGVPFPDFAREVMRRRMADAITKANRLKHQVLSYARRTKRSDEDSEGLEVFDYISSRQLGPEELVVQLEELRGVVGAILGLNDVERRAIIRAIDGHGPVDKADDNALYRGRTKLKRQREGGVMCPSK